MRMKTGMGRKLRYGGVTAALTAAIIAIVIIVNVIFSALAQKLLWYTDLTPELLFTLSENCIDLMNNGDLKFANDGSTSPIEKVKTFREEAPVKAADQAEENLKRETADKAETEARAAASAQGVTLTAEQISAVRAEAVNGIPQEQIDALRAEAAANADTDISINIIFCDTDLSWKEDTAQRYVFETAEQLEKEFPEYIKVKCIDIIRNPTAVTKYGSGVTTTSVIIECGSEFRVRSLKSFYVFNDSTTDEEPWAYNGEKILASSILAVTRASAPVACITTGHGEKLPGESFLLTLVNAGYDIRNIDLSKEDLPSDCRLVIISSPEGDFMVNHVAEDGENGGYKVVDEIDKLDVFLDNNNSLMVFMDPTLTYRLDNLEDYLEEWGIAFQREDKGGGVYEPYKVKDISQSLDEYGYNIVGNYVDFGLGAEITEELASMRRKIVFPNVMPITYSDAVGDPVPYFASETDKTVLGYYGEFDGREMYDLFVSGENAVVQADGIDKESAKNGNLFKFMTVTVEGDFIQESNYTVTETPAYVFATGCSEFYVDQLLHGQYGNNMFLEYTLRIIGHEPVPVGLTFKPFGDYTIDTVEAAQATTYTVIFTAVPLILSLGVGIFVIVRRKNR